MQQASGEILVFLDADTEPEPELLRRLVAAVQQSGGLVSVQPYHRTERAYERLSILFNLLGVMAVRLGRGGGVAFGPAMATSRNDYERAGGHAAVAGHVVEDWFMAHAYQSAGLTTSAYIGWQQLNYRMYPGGLKDLIHGFDKNFAAAAGEVVLAADAGGGAVAFGPVLGGLVSAGQPAGPAGDGKPIACRQRPALSRLCPAAHAAGAPGGQLRPGRTAVPLPVLFFLVVFVQAILNLKRGRIEWKGRRVDTHMEQR